jgi:hypothetical protein
MPERSSHGVRGEHSHESCILIITNSTFFGTWWNVTDARAFIAQDGRGSALSKWPSGTNLRVRSSLILENEDSQALEAAIAK